MIMITSIFVFQGPNYAFFSIFTNRRTEHLSTSMHEFKALLCLLGELFFNLGIVNFFDTTSPLRTTLALF
jgi:hypothetical protein